MKKAAAFLLSLMIVWTAAAAAAEKTYHLEIVSKGFQATYWQAVLKGARNEVSRPTPKPDTK